MNREFSTGAETNMRQSLGMPLRVAGGAGSVLPDSKQVRYPAKKPPIGSGQKQPKRLTYTASRGGRPSGGYHGAGSQQRQIQTGLGSSRPSTGR